MDRESVESQHKHEPATTKKTPWGLLPARMSVLYIGTPRRTGAWLAEAFGSDSACAVTLHETSGAASGLSRLRDESFDAVLVSHDPPELDALALLEGLRASGGDEPIVVLGQPSEQELAAQCFEVGADGYLCANSATTRMLLWMVARAAERRRLIREHRRLAQAEQHRLRQDKRETAALLSEQREIMRELDGADDGGNDAAVDVAESVCMLGSHMAAAAPLQLPPEVQLHYQELLRAHVIMGSGNLASEMGALADLLADADITAPQIMQLHVVVLEELVRGLGSRSARHVMTRADLLVLEMLVHLAECYRLRANEQSLAAASASVERS